MMDSQTVLPHKIVMNDRKTLTVTGVTEVVSFDETAVIANTQLGTLVVQGKELQLKTLLPEGGQVAVEGNISGLMYEEPRSVGSWWQRMFG